MGNLENKQLKGKDEQFKDDIYTQLIKMGYDEVLSYKAYNKFPNNLNKALHWVSVQTKYHKSNKISINEPHNKNKHTEKIRGKSIIDNDDIGVLSSTQTSNRNFIASKSNQFNIRKERFISRVLNKFQTTTTIKCDSISSCEAVQSIISVLYFYHQHKSKLQTLNAAKSNIPKIGDEIEINTAQENIMDTTTLDAKYDRFIERYSHEPSIDQFKRFAKIKYVDAKKYITSRKQDKKTHIHRGIVCGFKKRNCQIDIKQNDGKIYSYVLDEIQYKILKQDNDQFDELNLMGRSAVRHMSSELVQYLHSVDEWINHYEHVLYTHMKNDKQIELIHNEFIQKYNIHCELKKCSFYDRFNHKKYINDKNENEYPNMHNAFQLNHGLRDDYKNVDLVNDFHKLLHRSNEFENIYQMLIHQSNNNSPCVISECICMKRNQRNRTKNEIVLSELCDIVTQQLLDRVHCYFFHSFDIGYRLTKNDYVIVNQLCETNQNAEYYQKLYKFIEGKRNSYKDIEYFHRLKSVNKKYNQISDENDEKKCVENNNKKYSFGYKFIYLDRNKDRQLDDFKANDTVPVVPKFDSLKQELISNNIAIITVEQFNCEYDKANIHFNSTNRKQNYSDIKPEYLLSLMIYCNYTELQYKFSETYRTDNGNQHGNFFYLGKYLK
eukprot:429586_1